MGGAKRPFRLKSPGTSDQEVLRQRHEREGNSGQVAGNQAPDDLFARPVRVSPIYDATCANPLQSKVMPWPGRAGAIAMPCSRTSGCSI